MASQATSETTALLAPVVDGSAIITAQSVVNDGDAETTKYPKGIRFATIFGCVLLGDFLVGYVSFLSVQSPKRPLSPTD